METQLTPKQMTLLIKQALANGKITEEDVEQARRKEPSETLRYLTEKLHFLICSGQHDFLDDPTYCGFLQEGLLDNEWERPYHLQWSDYTELLLKSYEMSEKTLKDIFNDLLNIILSIEEIKRKYGPNSARFAIDVVSNSLPPKPAVQLSFLKG